MPLTLARIYEEDIKFDARNRRDEEETDLVILGATNVARSIRDCSSSL